MAGKFIQAFISHDLNVELTGVVTVLGITKREFLVHAIQEKIEKEREVITNKELARTFRVKSLTNKSKKEN